MKATRKIETIVKETVTLELEGDDFIILQSIAHWAAEETSFTFKAREIAKNFSTLKTEEL